MTSAAEPATATADLFVIFGITGDLAKKMTFGSLYRLEQRGLLDCPIIGVAAEELTVDELVARALIDGPDALDLADKTALLGDALALSRLHFAVWTAADTHPVWIQARHAAKPPRTIIPQIARSAA